jgi:tripartite-type tricarboxylate transporter receptor subunit TctC
MIEAGVPNFDVVVWHGISGPAGMPRPIVDRINAAVNKALADPDVAAREKKLGVEPIGGTPEKYQALVKQQLVLWDSVVKRASLSMRLRVSTQARQGHRKAGRPPPISAYEKMGLYDADSAQ